MVKIEIYLDEDEDTLLTEALPRSGHATYSKFATAVVLAEARRLLENNDE
tara:strand:- start:67 stop:216 length:150 start_codon:yes stop_codon:yes gene_type:complete